MDIELLISGCIAATFCYTFGNITGYNEEKKYLVEKEVEYKNKMKVLNEPRIIKDVYGRKFRTTPNPDIVLPYAGLFEDITTGAGRRLARKRFKDGKFDKIVQNFYSAIHSNSTVTKN